MCSGNQDLRPLRCCLYFKDIYLDTFCRLEYLTFYLLILCQDRIHFSEVDTYVLADIALYDSGHYVFFHTVILAVKHFSFFLADLL